jgi:uncharacterized protein YdiU (UPF0061 family)
MTLFFRGLADVDARSDRAAIEPLLHAYYVPEQLTPEIRARTERWLGDYVARLREDGVDADVRRANMNAVNPKFVLRNYLAQLAIDKAEQGDYSMVGELLEILRTPYSEQPGNEFFAQKRPDWARHRAGCSMLSCSS